MLKAHLQIGPYTLTSQIGEGAFGVVWLAERRTSIVTTRFALKFPKDAYLKLEEIKQEAEVWMQASGHPNVLSIVEAERYGDFVVIVSEYVQDGSLSTWLEEHKGSASRVDDAIEMMLGILAGLQHLHERNIIHRDLKPDNILLQSGTPRLADFGIARLLRTEQSTRIGGSPAYMAPEAFDGHRTIQTDIWAVGAIFYQLLAGHVPFGSPDMASLYKAILTADPKPLPQLVPPSVKQIIARSMEKEPEARYRSAAEMRRALRDASRTLEVGEAATIQNIPPSAFASNKLALSPLTGEQNLGPLVAKMCDRRQQENEFSDFFTANLRERPGCPQVALLRGEEKECHDSLIERLVSTRVKQIAERKWGAQNSSIVFKSADWPYEGEFGERQLELKRAVFAEFDPGYMENDLSVTALSRLSSLSLSPLVVVRHRIHASRWDQLTGELLRWYFGYWRDLRINPTGTQFLIFVSVIYPRAQRANWWKTLIGVRGFDKRSVEAELQTIATSGKDQLPILILKELMPIQPHEVQDWFSRYNIYDEKKRLELSEGLFARQGGRKADHLNMADIEHALLQIHQSYVKERGFLA
ncbi:MAG: eukaryotic-like serine/threonine-protein kinase [Acidobacteriota bacterium]|jgi:serine/threonine protein kinase|nr:eukaryotic-like serine/threonine-protein kinase [Acidobacteriota bacterium]